MKISDLSLILLLDWCVAGRRESQSIGLSNSSRATNMQIQFIVSVLLTGLILKFIHEEMENS